MQPHIRALRDQHHRRHPLHIRTESLVLHIGGRERRHVRVAAHLELLPLLPPGALAALRMKPHPDGGLFLLQHIHGQQQPPNVVAQQLRPIGPQKGQLALQRVRRSQLRRPQQIEQAHLRAGRVALVD